MDFDDWHVLYKEIIEEFGYDEEADISSSEILAGLLSEKEAISPDLLSELISSKPAIIIGPAFRPEDIDSLDKGAVVIATEGAVSQLLRHAIIPDIIMTDLDGDVEDQIKANSMGSLAVIHGHGDNMDALQAHVPRFTGKVMGTTQNRPQGIIQNFGGFTDGDRGVFLASHFDASYICLIGFDLDNPIPKPGKDIEVKKKKLAWAEKLIAIASEEL